ncbi:hypothetical protein NBO_272g0001 [Nosema bombycis CQ1]|uniref:Uncharacterized protein n=1 Tax=Nosema bombycis (strain CQ1 / CVCC 102059) TaxID=578461 RepID=R0KQJ1_NOSB1|nr:hypothetical protein NBO_272g0001 [Nosema bombycis CQ1]|eukprot:EOB12991.1 hypothetical protein NBO_272g0001 [Nosema bombycis CQ1]
MIITPRCYSFTVEVNREQLLSTYFIRKIGTRLRDSNTGASLHTNAPDVLSFRSRRLHTA